MGGGKPTAVLFPESGHLSPVGLPTGLRCPDPGFERAVDKQRNALFHLDLHEPHHFCDALDFLSQAGVEVEEF